MEKLFSTGINLNKQVLFFQVVFDKEKYQFIPVDQKEIASSFSLRREHDEWIAEGLSTEIKTQAVEALEKYLMKQH